MRPSAKQFTKEDTGQSTILFVISKLTYYAKVSLVIGQEKNPCESGDLRFLESYRKQGGEKGHLVFRDFWGKFL